MKIPKYFAALLIALTFAAAAKADVINISMNPFTGLPCNNVFTALAGNYSAAANFGSLLGQLSLYDAYHSANMVTPTMTGYFNGWSNTVDLTGYTYAVIQYSRGADTQNQGGAIQFVYLNGTTGNYTFPARGIGTDQFGSFASIRLFSVGGPVPVPESDRSIGLLGLTSIALLGTRRLIRA